MSKANIVNIFHSFGGKHSLWDLYNDFLKISAVTLSNSCDFLHRVEREAQYMETIKKYGNDELNKFAEIFANLVKLADKGFGDNLGELFMELELGSKLNGQFFTPYHVCTPTADMILTDVGDILKRQNYITVLEPSVGGGAMVIACAEVLKRKGHNYQKVMLVDCTDLDIKAVYMSYIQLSLYGIPAIVRHGNTISLEEYSQWYTPSYMIGGWAFKRQRDIPQIDYKLEQEHDGQMMFA